VVDKPVIGADLFPSFLEMTGLPLEPNHHLDGLSWASLLQGAEPTKPRILFWHNPAPRPASTADWFSSALRDGDLKLLEFPERNHLELYDLSNDLGEATDLAGQRPVDTQQLLDKLHRWQEAVGAAKPRPQRGQQAPLPE
jgi:arylsulfatase A-like enzyme